MARFFVIGSLALAALSHTCLSVTLVSDGFDDAGRTNGADALDAAWFETNAASNTSIQSAFASGAVFEGNNSLVFDAASIFRGIVGVFGSTSLGAVGSGSDTLTLSFDFRLVGGISSNGAGFRFGLYNDNGTSFTGDGNPADTTSQATDDFGYRAAFGTGSSSGRDMSRDNGGGDGGILSGSDNVGLALSSSTSLALNDNNPHSAVFAVSRTGALTFSLRAQVFSGTGGTGSVIGEASVSNETPPNGSFVTFNEIGIGFGNANNDFAIDNVLLTGNVPEPSTLCLLAVAGALTAVRRRRNPSKSNPRILPI